jgi:rubrerythrin
MADKRTVQDQGQKRSLASSDRKGKSAQNGSPVGIAARSMTHEHPLERLLRDTKEKDDLAAAAWAEEQRKALALREQVSQQWGRTKADLLREIDRANSVLEKYGLRERFGYREQTEPGPGHVARCNLALAYPSKAARAEYDISALAADGRMILLHRATGQRHQKLTVFTATRENWETTLVGLYEDHLKKGREAAQLNTDPAGSDAVAAICIKKSP